MEPMQNPHIQLIFDEPAWPDLATRDDAIVLPPSLAIAVLENGTAAGLPSLMIRLELPDGRPVLVETSARAFLQAARAIALRYGLTDHAVGLGG